MIAVAIIPARMSATRFPGKPLADICGKTMIEWVYRRAEQASHISKVIVATCDQEVMDAVAAFGGQAVMTRADHTSGTDRLAEVAANLDADVIVNVQGDEPLIDPQSIDAAVAPFLSDRSLQMTSLMSPISSQAAQDPNTVKVVVTKDNYALYFSRSPIPFERKKMAGSLYGHVGLYAYTKKFLLTYAAMQPTPLESAESLEQLRVLENGYRIKMVEITDRPMGVDTLEDLQRVIDVITG